MQPQKQPSNHNLPKSLEFDENQHTLALEIAQTNINDTPKRESQLSQLQLNEQFPKQLHTERFPKQLLTEQQRKERFMLLLQKSALDIPQQPSNNISQSIISFDVSISQPNIQSIQISKLIMEEKGIIEYGQLILSQSFIQGIDQSMIEASQQKESHYFRDLPLAIPLKYLGIKVTKTTFEISTYSFISLTDKPDIFTRNPQTLLFSLDLLSETHRKNKVGKKLLSQIQNTNKYLLNQILIGSHLKPEKLTNIFSIYYESLQMFTLERFWKKAFYPEHGLEFIDQKNIRNLRKIILKGDYLGNKMVESFKYAELTSLKVLQLRFIEEIQDKQLELMLQQIEVYSPSIRINLITSRVSRWMPDNDSSEKQFYLNFFLTHSDNRYRLINRQNDVSKSIQNPGDDD